MSNCSASAVHARPSSQLALLGHAAVLAIWPDAHTLLIDLLAVFPADEDKAWSENNR